MIDRIRKQNYAKILVQDFHSPHFLYDWADWEEPSGVRQALLDYYVEVRTVAAPDDDTLLPPTIMYTGPVSVLVPK
jgi:hypothetical protein